MTKRSIIKLSIIAVIMGVTFGVLYIMHIAHILGDLCAYDPSCISRTNFVYHDALISINPMEADQVHSCLVKT